MISKVLSSPQMTSGPFVLSQIHTKLGPMLAVADQRRLCLLAFVDESKLPSKIQKLRQATRQDMTSGTAGPIEKVQAALDAYFQGDRGAFETAFPLRDLLFQGHHSPFHQCVWSALQTIPPGQSRTYSAHAQLVGKPRACRAVGNAIGANPFPLLLPCHRVIRGDGSFGGYAGGLQRKAWLLAHERAQN